MFCMIQEILKSVYSKGKMRCGQRKGCVAQFVKKDINQAIWSCLEDTFLMEWVDSLPLRGKFHQIY